MSSASPLPFDRALVRRHWQRARASIAENDFLFRETSSQLLERLDDIKRSFSLAADLSPLPFLMDSNKVESCFSLGTDFDGDEEFLPLAPQSVDLVASNLALHWVNDVPGALSQIHTALKPDGLFLAALIGGQSLGELRQCLMEAEIAVYGGVSPHLSPTIDAATASSLMLRAGFTLPVVDQETLTLRYRDAFALMHDLRGMGQTNALNERLRTPSKRALFLETARLYAERFADTDGLIPVRFDILYLHGWK